MLTLKNESDDVTVELCSDDSGVAFKRVQLSGGQVECETATLTREEARERFLAHAAREFDALWA